MAQFQKGDNWNGNSKGRPVGSRNKLTEYFIADLYESWRSKGMRAINRVIEEHPSDYLRVVASLVPKDVNLNVSLFESMTEDELRITIQRLRADPDVSRLIESGREGSDVCRGDVVCEEAF